ncbi:helix-turn-helix domain-containing protein [Kineosporia babensis]|uniref:Helix-turn-helix domain-containing protein n=1 Tax=Kineosporia babensis TaxID=499548 RepID=A0A9X1NJB4_9ACTN|nr:helix-turn-helix transcriptional regulator [Kineosporia babensis]MCD5314849.1 helix-turn-helix domain-containing protein [Kineosporia babensis]
MSRSNQVVAPTLAQRRLSERLRAARVAAGRSQEDAATALDCDVTKIYRIESGRTAAKPADVQALGFTYGLDRKSIDDMVLLSRGAKTRGWTDNYLDMIPSDLSMLADLEANACTILSYSVEKVPGLLQTEDYARSVIDLADELPSAKRESLLRFRLERQERLLDRESAPRLGFVIHEAALRVAVGSRSVLSGQISSLRELDSDDVADIRVWPFSAGLHRWMSGAFILLEFASRNEPSVVYTENQVAAHYLESREQVSRFASMFQDLRNRSIPMKEFA